MTGISDNDAKKIAKAIIKEAKAEHKSFYIEPEEHYQDHQALKAWRTNLGTASKIMMTTLLGLLAVGAIVLIILGFTKGVGLLHFSSFMFSQIWGHA